MDSSNDPTAFTNSSKCDGDELMSEELMSDTTSSNEPDPMIGKIVTIVDGLACRIDSPSLFSAVGNDEGCGIDSLHGTSSGSIDETMVMEGEGTEAMDGERRQSVAAENASVLL